MEDNTKNVAIGWDDEIDGNVEQRSLDPLPAGVYDFKVSGFERGYFSGSDKMPACPVANVEFEVMDADGNPRKVWDKMFLTTKSTWKIALFFKAIGQSKDGNFRPNWNLVPGSTGRFQLSVNHYTSKDGEERANNRVRTYLEPAKKTFEAGKF